MKIGIDLGGTNIAAGLVSESGSVLDKISCPTLSLRGPESVMDDMIRLSLELCDKNSLPIDSIEHIGIGSPGTSNRSTGEVLFSNNLNWHHVQLGTYMSERLLRPVTVINDANAAALGETLFGAAKGASSAVMLTLGTGVGGGIVLQGKVFDGFHHAGAELGHTLLHQGGRLCTCGRRGCLEMYASASALIHFGTLAAKESSGFLSEVYHRNQALTGLDIFQAADLYHDESAQNVIEDYLRDVADGIADFINVFEPEVFVLGGGIAAQGDRILEPIRAMVSESVFCKDIPLCRIVAAQLGNDAGIAGAAFASFI